MDPSLLAISGQLELVLFCQSDWGLVDTALVAHANLGNTHDLLIVVRKGDALDGCQELPCEQALAYLH